jgi:predicted enzyme related to lactoylglutathione lyase
MKRVTGLGGIFFKCQDPELVKNWYKKHLGFETEDCGTSFEWRKVDDPDQKGYTLWSPFPARTEYFGSEKQSYMINYRVENLQALVKQLELEGVVVLDKIEEYEYGKFVHILDPEGNRIELWQPVDEVYGKMIKGVTGVTEEKMDQ